MMKKAKRYVLLCLMAMVSVMALAVPAKPGLTRQLQLTDGTTVTARLIGDEHGHYWLGQDGKAYTVNSEGVATTVDAEAVKARAQARRQQNNARRAKRLAPRKVGDVGSITGQKKGLIILVNFKGTSFKSANNNALYQRIANEVNFSYGDFKGSMYDYFYAQSDGQFQLTFDVVGPFEVSNAYSYYGANDSSDNDKYPATMVIEALKLADSQVNYADYDWDDDGEVEQVYVVYAGQGEADGGSSDTIWPHEWELSSAAQYGDGSGSQTLDGVTIDTYACGGELNGSGNIAGIGTMCHEFSHCLGYPDFYDTDYSGGQGMFEWDLMDSGSYNDDGYRPAGYTSYERWVAGWREPIELTTTQQISNMPALVNSGAQSYVIYNQGNRNEYFLLENRQKTGWDTNIPGAGLLILHVDYSSSAWSGNTPNDDPSHQRMTWIAADNEYQYTTYQGTKYYTTSGAANDPFPYGSVNAFNKSTTPAAKFYNKNSDNTYYLDSSIENITQNSNGTVSFLFQGISNVATPTFSPAAGRYAEAQTVSISCTTSGSTIYYTTDGTTPTANSSVYSTPLTISETTTVRAMAIADNEQSAIATAKYTIGQSTSDPTTTTFRRVTSVDDLEPGMRYVIACGSKNTAAGAHSSTYLGAESVTISDDVITIGSGVAVFVLEGDQDTGWTFQNESTNEYLYATAAKSVKYSSDENLWTLSDGTDGVIMTYDSFGTMLYNSSSPRFTTYTSNPNASMIQANLYMEDSSVTPITPDPTIVAEESLTFSTTVGTPQTKTFEVLTEGLTESVTLTLADQNNVFSLGQNTIANTVSDANVSVTFSPTTVGTFTATVTLTSAGAEPVTVTLTGTATEQGTTPVDPTGGTTLLYEGVSGYTSASDGTQALTASSSNLDYDGWTDITKVYAGGTSNSYDEGEGGCLKFGSSSANGSITTSSLALSGNGTLTFYLKQYGTDTGKLNVTVTGATADVTQFTPSSSWTLCTVNLTGGNGAVTITFATTSKRAYLDEITLITAAGDTPVQKQDIDLQFTEPEASATIGETFTAPTLTCNLEAMPAVTYSSSNEQVATVNAQTGEVTLVAAGTTVITASFAGDDTYNAAEASYTLTVSDGTTPDPTGGETLLYEGVSGYTAANDGSQALTASSDYFDYDGWTDITKVYAGGTSKAYNETGGCLKFGSSNAAGSITTSSLALSGDGTLTFYLKQYGSDTGKLNVTVTGATADVTEFTPSSSWTLCTVNLTGGNGAVTITFATSSKRAYLDEITLITAAGDTPVQKQDIDLQFTETEASATIGESFTAPELIIEPSGLAVTYSSSNEQVATVNAQTGEVTLVAAGTTVIAASFAGDDTYNAAEASYTLTVSAGSTPSGDTNKYELVTDVTTLADGDEILIAYVSESEGALVLSTTQNTNNRAATSDVTTNDDGTLTPGAEAQVITLEQDGSNFLFNVGNGYLYAASSSKNYLRTETEADDNAKATIFIDDAAATITFQGSNTRNEMRYNSNNGSPLFSCYASTSTTGALPQIYKKVASTQTIEGDVDGNGELEQADLETIVQILIGNLAAGQFPNADVDGENGVTLSDITHLVNLLRQHQQQSGE